MFTEEFLKDAILAAPAILMALTFHEFAHAWTALKFGDPTARDMGRLSLNPLRHLDLIGTIMLFVSHFRFGWAKPVPVNPMNLRNPRVADIWISAAGPISNLILALIFGTMFRIVAGGNPPEAIYMFLYLSVIINISLACFNMIPLFPLDGSHILRNLLPESYGPQLDMFDRISPIILILFIILGWFWIVLGPLVKILFYIFTGAYLPW
jgi:Zn-dependent protease